MICDFGHWTRIPKGQKPSFANLWTEMDDVHMVGCLERIRYGKIWQWNNLNNQTVTLGLGL